MDTKPQEERPAHAGGPDEPERQPMFNAPLIAVGMAALMVVLHGLTSLMDRESLDWLYIDYQLDPRRFWTDDHPLLTYPSFVAKYQTLVTSGFLHADWLHVLLNSGFLLAFGAPVARTLGTDAIGTGKWLVVFIGSVIGGSILFLLLNFPPAYPAVGASGGVSGLMAAAFLIAPDGTVGSPLSARFLKFTGLIALANLLIVFVGPYLFGAFIAWEAHAGGYLAGAIFMLLFGPRVPRYGGMDTGFENR